MADPNRFADGILEMDATTPLEFDAIEDGWKVTIEERRTVEADTQRAFRERNPTPSHVIQSAEGIMLFPGFGGTKEGVLLNAVARAAVTGEGLADVESQTRESLAAD